MTPERALQVLSLPNETVAAYLEASDSLRTLIRLAREVVATVVLYESDGGYGDCDVDMDTLRALRDHLEGNDA